MIVAGPHSARGEPARRLGSCIHRCLILLFHHSLTTCSIKLSIYHDGSNNVVQVCSFIKPWTVCSNMHEHASLSTTLFKLASSTMFNLASSTMFMHFYVRPVCIKPISKKPSESLTGSKRATFWSPAIRRLPVRFPSGTQKFFWDYRLDYARTLKIILHPLPVSTN